MAEVRMCLWCRHFSLIEADRGYSSWTPGSDMSMSCDKNVWHYNPYEDGSAAFGAKLATAAECPMYELNPDLLPEHLKG